MDSKIETICEDFSFLDDWEDRYRYVIDLGRTLETYPEAERTPANKVQGCVSQVWLNTSIEKGDDPVLSFAADSDAHIVRGLIAILLALYSGKTASQVLATNAEETFESLGLYEHLTPQRANGIRSMIARIRHEAQSALAHAA